MTEVNPYEAKQVRMDGKNTIVKNKILQTSRVFYDLEAYEV